MASSTPPVPDAAPPRAGFKRGHLLLVDGEVMVAGAFCKAPVPPVADCRDDPHFTDVAIGFSAFATRLEALGYGARLHSVLGLQLEHVTDHRSQLSALVQRTVFAELAHWCGCGAPAVPGCVRLVENSGFGWYEREYGPRQVFEVDSACEGCDDPATARLVRDAGITLTVRSKELEAWCERTRWRPPTSCCCEYRQPMWGTYDPPGMHGGWKRWHWHLRGESVFLTEELDADGRRAGAARLGRCRVCRSWWHELDGSMAPDGFLLAVPVSDEEAERLLAAA
jgi:hypothetical protein